eukprot:15458009-Alexandrium_andersonii.AAC.1
MLRFVPIAAAPSRPLLGRPLPAAYPRGRRARIRGRQTTGVGIAADSVAEVLHLPVDGVFEVLQLLTVSEDLGLEALGSGGRLHLRVPNALKPFGAGGEEGFHGSP